MKNKVAIVGYNQVGQSLHRMLSLSSDIEVSYIFSESRDDGIFVNNLQEILFDPDIRYILECTDNENMWDILEWCSSNNKRHLISSNKVFWEDYHEEVIARFSKKYRPSLPDNPNIWLGSLFALGNGTSKNPTARFKTIQLFAGEINKFRGGTEVAVASIMTAELKAAMAGHTKMPRTS